MIDLNHHSIIIIWEMKCTVCGFEENLAHAAVCKQCGAAFQGASAIEDNKKTTLSLGQDPHAVTKYTVLGKQSGALEQPSNSEGRHCAHCGYQMRKGLDLCPNCGFEHTSSVGNAVVPEQKSTTRVGPKTKRIEEFTGESGGPRISLIPINSKKASSLETYGQELVLDRGKVDETDDTISTSPHLRIYFDEEMKEWRLENAATNKAVFIQVEGTVSIRPGAVIQVGQNKLFQFKIEE